MAIKKILKDGNGNQMWPITRADCIYMTGTDNKKLIDYLTTALSGKSDSGHTHNYAASSSAGGAATSANKVNQSLKIQLNGGTTEGSSQFTFNGSAAKTVNITASSIGAAAASHGTHVTYATATPKANGTAAVGSSDKVAREDHVHPLQTNVSGSSGSCTGNAATATKAAQLTNARNIIIGSATKSFNGTANVSYTLAEIGAMPVEPLTTDELNGIFTDLGL